MAIQIGIPTEIDHLVAQAQETAGFYHYFRRHEVICVRLKRLTGALSVQLPGLVAQSKPRACNDAGHGQNRPCRLQRQAADALAYGATHDRDATKTDQDTSGDMVSHIGRVAKQLARKYRSDQGLRVYPSANILFIA